MSAGWDPNPIKDAVNREKHGISFRSARRFEWETAVEQRDERKRYEEVRTIAIGFIGQRLHVLVYTRRGSLYRPISLREARRKEILRYADFAQDLE